MSTPPANQPHDLPHGSSRRSFLAWGAAGAAGVAATVAGCGTKTSGPTPLTGSDGTEASPAVAGSLAHEILADKPLLYVDFQDDADAKLPVDRSGHHRTLKLVGTAWWPNDALSLAAPDAVGRAWYSGVSDDKCSITVADGRTWLADAAKTGVTVEMWICQAESNYNQTFLQVASDGDDTGWACGLSSDGSTFNLEGPGYKNVQVNLPTKLPNAWHHVAVSFDAQGTVTAYLDGHKLGGGSVGPFKGNVKDVLIGSKTSGGAPLTGQWAHLAVHGSALSAERVAAHHAAGVAAAEPAIRGVDTWFGGPDYYKQFTGAEVLADHNRFPVAEWWMNAFPEEFGTEKTYADGAVLLDPNVAPAGPRQAGIWVIRMVGMAMTGTPGAETIGWMPQDEPDMDADKMKEFATNITKIPAKHLSYANYGTGVTISTIDRYRVRPLVARTGIDQVSADLYSYCTKPVMSQQVADAWQIDKGLVRRAAAHGLVVSRARAFLTIPQPVWGVVAIGHANTVADGEEGWASVPSADEVEGSIWSCITHGASGILLFPQTFADAKTAAKWSASTQYAAGDTVADTSQEQVFWYARTTPKKGVDPNTVTDDSWLRWMPNVTGIRNKDHYARGVSDRVAAVKAALQKLAPVLNSRSVPHRFHADLDSRYWPTTPDGHAYAVAMQRLGKDSGSYVLNLPSGVKATSVEVVGENRTLAVSKGTVSDSFDAEWRHHLYRWAV